MLGYDFINAVKNGMIFKTKYKVAEMSRAKSPSIQLLRTTSNNEMNMSEYTNLRREAKMWIDPK
eukprot:scaffold1049_cov168-Amphora_coffeaeformis.AAC.15